MEFILFVFGIFGIWGFARTISNRSRLESLEISNKALQDAMIHFQQQHEVELQKLRNSTLTLLRAHEALRERVSTLQATPPAPVVPALPSPPPQLAETSPQPAWIGEQTPPPPIEAPAADAVIAAAAAAGLAVEDAAPASSFAPASVEAPPSAVEAPPSAVEAPPAEIPVEPPATPQPAAGLPADILGPATAPPLEEVPSLRTDKPFDFEQLLGVRGAAWLGAIALVIAGTLFAKYSIENDLIKPPLRIALLLLCGVGALIGAELGLRRRYEVTANALCGGGVAILYAAFFAAHNLYDLISLPATFGLMSLTTLAAALLSLRHDNVWIAVLGLFGGFATPLALSTGQDRPFALFGYVLVLDLGFVALAIRRGWHRLALLSLALTLIMEAGWADKFLVVEKMPTAVGIAALFGLLFMTLPVLGRRLDAAKQRELLYGGGAAGLVPFLLAMFMAGQPEFAQRWPLLFGLVAILDLGLLALSVTRWPELASGALVATVATHAMWASSWLHPSGMPVAIGTALVFMALFAALPTAWRVLHPAEPAPSPDATTSPPGAPDILHRVADLAILAPFALAIGLAAYHDYATQTVLLFGFLGLLCAASLALALVRGRPHLVLWAAILSTTTRLVWGASALHNGDRLQQGTVTALLLAGLLSLGPRFAAWLHPELPPEQARRHEFAAAISWIGLLAAAWQILLMELGPPPGTLLILVAALIGLWVERTRRPDTTLDRLAPLGIAGLAMMLQLWLGMGFTALDRGVSTPVLAYGIQLAILIPVIATAVLHAIAALRSWRSSLRQPGASPTNLQATEVSAVIATLIGLFGLLVMAPFKGFVGQPALCFGSLLVYSALLAVQALRRGWMPLWLVSLGASAALCAIWRESNLDQKTATTLLGWSAGLYLPHLLLPLVLLWKKPGLRLSRSLYLCAGLAGPLLFSPMLEAWRVAFGSQAIGLLPVLLAAGAGIGFWAARTLPPTAESSPSAKLSPEALAGRHLTQQALFALASFGFIAVAIPMQLKHEWIPISWAIEATAVWWIYRGLPHLTLKYFGALIYALAVLALWPSEEFLHYHERGQLVLNWLLYTYGVPSACLLLGAAGLGRVEAQHRAAFERAAVTALETPFATFAYYTGLLLIFALINIEIANAFSTGTYTELWQERGYARDLIRSVAWGLYAIGLLLIGVRQRSKAQRYFSLAFMLLTILKVFLYDLANVGGLYRALSFLGLAVSLILVSLLYQRFVFPRAEKTPTPKPAP